MSKVYDCLVLGIGGVGSAALYYAARRGWRTLGVDRFSPGHARGSSHGRTRIIRQAYFEHPDYVPLLIDAYQLWRDLEEASGQQFFRRTGLLQIGDPQGTVIRGIRRSAEQHRLAIGEYTAAELQTRFPFFQCRDSDVGIFEENAGFLRVEESIAAWVGLAREQGAELLERAVVEGWSTGPTGFELQTSEGRVHARRLIVAAGAWTAQLVPELAGHLKVIAKHQHWFYIPDERATLQQACPVFFFETAQGYFYGFPDIDGQGCKMSEHSGGTPVTDPLTVSRQLDPGDLQRVQDFAQSHFATPPASHLKHSVCMYTMSPDEHFMVDVADPHMAFAAGLSGHGFKFAPLLGKSLVDLVDGRERDDMDFLRVKRFNDSLV
jgi:monomeric sarcosine oxidase